MARGFCLARAMFPDFSRGVDCAGNVLTRGVSVVFLIILIVGFVLSLFANADTWLSMWLFCMVGCVVSLYRIGKNSVNACIAMASVFAVAAFCVAAMAEFV